MASPISPALSPNSTIPSSITSPVLMPHSPHDIRFQSPRTSVESSSGPAASATTYNTSSGPRRNHSSTKLLPSTSSISLLSLTFANSTLDEAGSGQMASGSNVGMLVSPGAAGTAGGSDRLVSPSSPPHINSAYFSRYGAYQRTKRFSSSSGPMTPGGTPIGTSNSVSMLSVLEVPNSPELNPISASSSPTRAVLISQPSALSLDTLAASTGNSLDQQNLQHRPPPLPSLASVHGDSSSSTATLTNTRGETESDGHGNSNDSTSSINTTHATASTNTIARPILIPASSASSGSSGSSRAPESPTLNPVRTPGEAMTPMNLSYTR